MSVDQLIPTAQYLRMSTEHQQYSLENQSSAIQIYAEAHGFEIVRTYSDSAKSGLVLRHRTGLQQLLQDVVRGDAGYQIILVYDVSRWGRFQDTDESAHYEFLCKSAGVPVHYCAETFANDGSLPSLIMKALKRTMAGEYSRELSVKVFAGQKRLTLLGFKAGGVPGYGLRRMLISSVGVPKQELAFGERKSIATDRVILVPGPPHEVQTVKDIYRMLISEKRSVSAIARKLNRNGVPRPGHSKWDFSAIRMILTHPKYVGCAVFGQISRKLHTPAVKVPKSEWIVKPGAFKSIIDPATFAQAQAQKPFGRRPIHKTDEELLGDLRTLLASEGKLSWNVIKDSPQVMGPRTYCNRFGCMQNAYKLVGYDRPEWLGGTNTRLRLKAVREELISQIAKMFPNEVSIVKPGVHWRTRLRLFNRLTVSVVVVRSALLRKTTRRWIVEPLLHERKFITLLARLDEGNRAIVDFHVVPNFNRAKKLQVSDAWLTRGKQLTDLSRFCDVVVQVQYARRSKVRKSYL
jgi:DNA invertase Pin-like site-specific DNA recombinase